MNAVVYDIEFNKVAQWWSPHQLCKTFWLKWIGVFLYPIAQLHQLFLKFRKAKLYELSITPQVCYLEALLNDRFDLINRGIYIGDPIDKSPLYIYVEAETKPKYLYTEAEDQPKYLYTDGEAGQNGDDFIVWVPVAVVFDPLEMRSLVNKFKLAGMKFKIQTF